MDKQDEVSFQKLTKHREGLAKALEDPALRGVQSSVVDKYRDQAHFIYELLQNADDAFATNARFILEKDKLIFAHNGSRHFSISDPDKEKEDSGTNALGDINAITSVANSSKTTGSTIGKFGVGFKAVFQYTATPRVYDPNFCFRIERFIVPVVLNEDYPGRREDETLFVFPFDHKEREPAEAYRDISEKLKNLSYPLLFLSNLKNIEFEFGNVLGLYDKRIEETRVIDDTKAEYIVLTQNDGDDLYDEYLWLFSREYDRGEEYNGDGRYLTYSAGFFTDQESHLIPIDMPAFCYFPTKEYTDLKFIVHAPFLLTDSREGIKAGEPHNDKMINALADLSADAIEYLRDIGIEKGIRLIDDSIVEIIPVYEDEFSDPEDKNQISFLPFFERIKEKFEKSELLPGKDGYVRKGNAYWASVSQIPQLFSDSQLGEIVENPDACWVFPTLSRDEVQRNNRELFSYIDSLVRTNINEDIVLSGRTREFFVRSGIRQSLENIKGITGEFIENQPIEWLHDLYKWISETKHRKDVASSKPIFIDQDGKASAAFDKAGQLILFLPVKNMTGYRMVNSALLEKEETRNFIDQIGIKQPSLRDQIYNIILPQYEDGAEIDTDPHFKMFFEYYCKCSNSEVDEFIGLIKGCQFLTYSDPDDGVAYRAEASSMYLPTAEMKAYFETKPDTRFIALDEYKEMVGVSKENQLMRFLMSLGIKTDVAIFRTEVNYYTSGRNDLPTPHSTRGVTYDEKIIDGCKEILAYIEDTEDSTKSVLLWNCLLKITETRCTSWNCRDIEALLRGDCHYFYYSSQVTSFTSSDVIALKETAWLVNSDGDFSLPEDLTVDTLSDIYDTSSEAANNLLDILGIQEAEEEDSNLTDEQREKIAFANKLLEYGIEDEDDLEEFREFKRQREAQRQAAGAVSHDDYGNPSTDNAADDVDMDDIFEEEEGTPNSDEKKPLDKATSDVVKDIVRRTKQKPDESKKKRIAEDEDVDGDELIPSTVDYQKKIERAKEKSAAEIEKITYFEELQNRAVEAEKYTYEWFNALLEMESLNSGELNADSKEVSISFAKVERESGTKRTLVLKHPNRYIPQFMEDLADIPMILHMGDQTKTVAIEVANIKSYTLRVKMKNASDIDGIDLESVTSVTIDAKSPAFLLEELRKQFTELEYEDGFSMKDNLCKNIEFVFGPPGTGKTTHLAQNVLIPMMRENKDCKVLVLTPTNKSADVLVRRIMEVSGNDHTYNNWLVRFGATGDEEIEQSPVFRDKTFDIRTLDKHVTVTTIARFPYDFFMPQGARIFLYGINWDYIVIDEASMIPIANIVFPLYKKTPRKFIIAGDPFQIEPITSVDLWKNENIYTMVELDSFTDPTTVPYQYKVELLTTQYRSVPDIGHVFSNFAYGGILKHHRSADSQRPLNVGNDLGIETLNIIKFPVSKYESIYRCKRLQHSSSYQVYSALFTYEYVFYLSRVIADNNPNEQFNIGVIAPYRAQADMIDKMIASEKLPKTVDVQVGTIHGFQGDECDIIFAVFNTPPSISSSKEMFLNKRNIINVSISRARDYLFVVMPDDNTENISNLRLVKRVEDLMHSTDAWMEFLSTDLEELMFGDSKYLENNAFSTSHQSVNVYGLPEKCYEVRTEDTAVDVQIHKPSTNSGNVSTDSNSSEYAPDKDDEYISSYQLKEELIPEELRETAIDLPVKGVIKGWCYLVPYDGKLKTHTIKKTKGMFIPLMRNGQEKMVSVSVVPEDRIIYISQDMFKLYEQALSEPDGIELRKGFF